MSDIDAVTRLFEKLGFECVRIESYLMIEVGNYNRDVPFIIEELVRSRVNVPEVKPAETPIELLLRKLGRQR